MSEMLQKSVNLEPEAITKRDVSLAWLRFYFANEIPHSFDKYIAPSLMWALMPILKKLYKDKKDLSEAYQRHLLFFNTQISWGGGTITGIMASLEAARAQEVYMDTPVTIDDDLIYNTKAGLMGALAGIGDSIDSGTIQYIFIAIALPCTAGKRNRRLVSVRHVLLVSAGYRLLLRAAGLQAGSHSCHGGRRYEDADHY